MAAGELNDIRPTAYSSHRSYSRSPDEPRMEVDTIRHYGDTLLISNLWRGDTIALAETWAEGR